MICPRCKGKGHILTDREIGLKMRARREAAGITLRDFASRLVLSAAFVSDLERGRRNWSKIQIGRYDHILGKEDEEDQDLVTP